MMVLLHWLDCSSWEKATRIARLGICGIAKTRKFLPHPAFQPWKPVESGKSPLRDKTSTFIREEYKAFCLWSLSLAGSIP